MNQEVISEKSVKELGEVKIVGFRVVCADERYIEEIPKAAKVLKERTVEIENVTNSGQQIGAFVVEESSPEQDGYWIGVQVSEYKDIPENMTTLTIPAQRYATILHIGPNNLMRNSYAQLHQWIEEKGYIRSNTSWNLELYQKENDPENLRVELFNYIL
ncbi:GyrI-like domain-containing protein [Alkalihalobacillus sp. AL-G]|uniref:GyrI-like domain-containing protein n=1 Tax=Alkalihalobacillus sp. AL-G TaxID=2926399 RepID=UPI00272D3A0E|nr:GyrI-like domain-containing protein [Alkalihalobacillus sp. AL-G]WLD92304.1 GyrI-like domain-containing protein [Alkalihalobacillus sp. AL-G]